MAEQELDQKVVEGLKKRKTIVLEITKYFQVTKGSHFALERKKKVADLTSDMLLTGDW